MSPGSYETVLPGPCHGNHCDPEIGWADSYSVGGRCYCTYARHSFDHGIGDVVLRHGNLTHTVREVCDRIVTTFGVGSLQGRLFYNTVQCGHPPYNDDGMRDEVFDACPGRVDAGRNGCRILGPAFDLAGIYAAEGASEAQPPEDTGTHGGLTSTGDAMASAATALLASLSAELRSEAQFDFESDQRYRANTQPLTITNRRGLTLRDMSEAQQDLAVALLDTGLSGVGFFTVTVQKQLEGWRSGRDANPVWGELGSYVITIFGDPAGGDPWGWRYEGWHVSLHFTVLRPGGEVDVTSFPIFMGSMAMVLDEENNGLALTDAAAWQLFRSLNASQTDMAVQSGSLPEGFTQSTGSLGNHWDAPVATSLEARTMLPYGMLDRDQQTALFSILEHITALMEPEIATARLDGVIAAGLGTIAFGWWGSTRVSGTK